ncbi:hypothetical protein CYMTET_8575 [Cymbomonas tetramitiformis]|uniref:Uncharacterized protein n=1 Tax=Cymbomonas tetramitiformis TaxID=36881 RepID=A0AAE0LFP7_9CHLO|nr:hypothetical protein CYMTET_8575 [Cymbomonas tetramitiformis]
MLPGKFAPHKKAKGGVAPKSTKAAGGSRANDEAPSSIRAHYVSEGVEDYYRNNEYVNPHEDRVNKVLKMCWLEWGVVEHCATSSSESPGRVLPKLTRSDAGITNPEPLVSILDLSAGSGEVTNAVLEMIVEGTEDEKILSSVLKGQCKRGKSASQRKESKKPTPIIASNVRIFATDPYTHETYNQRFVGLETLSLGISRLGEAIPSLPRPLLCWKYSFEDIIDGCFFYSREPDERSMKVDPHVPIPSEQNPEAGHKFDVSICSYAMHLASDEKLPCVAMNLATVTKLLIIITPHKRPILDPGAEYGEASGAWGWTKRGEIVLDRTRAVLYESCLFSS